MEAAVITQIVILKISTDAQEGATKIQRDFMHF